MIPSIHRLTHWPEFFTDSPQSIKSKSYPRFPNIKLPEPQSINNPLHELLTRRKSAESFTDTSPLSLQALSTLLLYGAGTNTKDTKRKHHPSGGGLYSIETYVATLDTHSLNEGVHHYNASDHCLEQLVFSTFDDFRACMPGFDLLQNTPTYIVLSAKWQNLFNRYDTFGYRLALMEMGHVMQNLLMSCTALNINARPIGGFYEDQMNSCLRLDSNEEAVVYILAAGQE